MKKETALVVFSGGQDSTTCLFWAKKNFSKVCALSFIYGQKHVKEVELARAIAQKAGVDFDVMDVSFIGSLGKNSLTDTSIEMDQVKPADSVPNTFVPGRNLFFLSIAAVYARERGIRHLVTGLSQTVIPSDETSALSPRSPITASIAVLFPEPDSPTIPAISPFPTEKLILSSAFFLPCPV